jgi:hypothetical protein
MDLTLITKEELKAFKDEIIEEIRKCLDETKQEKEWLKTPEVREILGCSEGTFYNLKSSGRLPFSKINGTIYVKKDDLNKLFESNFVA